MSDWWLLELGLSAVGLRLLLLGVWEFIGNQTQLKCIRAAPSELTRYMKGGIQSESLGEAFLA